MKTTNNELLYYYAVLNNLKSTSIDFHKIFLYYIDLNLCRMKDLAESALALRQSTAPSKEYIEFTNKKQELIEKYCAIDDNSITINEETKDEFNELYQLLIEEYGKYVVEHDAYSAEIGRFLDFEISIDEVKIPWQYFPNEMSSSIYDVIKHFIDGDESDIKGKFDEQI